MIYTAKSLEEVAKMLDARADDEVRRGEQWAKTKKDKEYHRGAASAYRDAASVLRQTEIKP